MKSHVSWMALATTVVLILAHSQVSAGEGNPARFAAALNSASDARLFTRVSVTAYHTTVGRILEELSRKTGVRCRPGDGVVREEPLIVFMNDRPLTSVLRLMAEEFRWGDDRQSGWQWERRTVASGIEYALVRDLKTQRVHEEMRQRDRRLFAAALEQELRNYRGRRGTGIAREDVVAALPPAVWQAALAGKTTTLTWANMPETLRALVREVLASKSPQPEEVYVAVSTVGEGSTLNLNVVFAVKGRVAKGPLIQPAAYRARFPASWPYLGTGGAPPKIAEYMGSASRLLKLKPEDLRTWSTAKTLPPLLELMSSSTGTDIICDDYHYSVYWGRSLRSPAGEPLGFWLDGLPAGITALRHSDGSMLKWREADGCILLRNRDWYADDGLRPPPDVLTWLRKLQQSEAAVLTPFDVTHLLSRVDSYGLGALAQSGLLPQALSFDGFRGYFGVLAILSPLQQRKLLSSTGLSSTDLSPGQRATATAEGGGLHPFFTERRASQGAPVRTSMVVDKHGRLTLTRTPPVPAVPRVFDLRLPDKNPEVCRVSRSRMAGPPN